VDVRIGVTNTMREIDLDVDDSIERDQLKDHIEKALSSDDGVLWMADKKGREVAIPSSKVAYVEIGSPADGRTIGFTA
jgi:Protein of unknown function (DUF3107)